MGGFATWLGMSDRRQMKEDRSTQRPIFDQKLEVVVVVEADATNYSVWQSLLDSS